MSLSALSAAISVDDASWHADNFVRTSDQISLSPTKSGSQLEAFTAAAAASEHLPGGDMYAKYLGSNIGNPRGNKAVRQWLQEWERKWDTIAGDCGPDSECILPSLLVS